MLCLATENLRGLSWMYLNLAYVDRQVLQDTFYCLVVQDFDLCTSVKQEMHSKTVDHMKQRTLQSQWEDLPGVYGHALEEPLATPSELYIVPNMILRGEIFDARDQL